MPSESTAAVASPTTSAAVMDGAPSRMWVKVPIAAKGRVVVETAVLVGLGPGRRDAQLPHHVRTLPRERLGHHASSVLPA